MTTQPLNKANNYALKYFFTKLRFMKTNIIMSCIFGLLSVPLVGIASLYYSMVADNEYLQESANNMAASSFAICAFSLCAIGIFAIFIPMQNFGYLNTKSKVDMYNALPLTTKGRFWADYLAGLAVSVVPYIIASSMGFIMITVAKNIYMGKMLEPDELINDSLCGSIGLLLLTGLIALITANIISTFITTCCGKSIDASIFSVIVMVLVPLLGWMIYYATTSGTFGLDIQYNFIGVVEKLPPFGLLIATLFSGDFYSMLIEQNLPVSHLDTLLIIGLISAALLIGAYYLNKFRKAENVGKPFVYKSIYYVLMFFVILSIVLTFGIIIMQTIEETNIVPFIITMVIITFVVYIVFDVINSRGIKDVGWSLLRYVGTMVVCCVLTALFLNCRSFGASYYVPQENEIKSVQVSITNEKQSENYAIYTDENTIKQITNIHNEIIKQYFSDNINGYINSSQVVIKYSLKNNSIVTRTYYVNDGEIPMLELNKLKETPSYIDLLKEKYESFSDGTQSIFAYKVPYFDEVSDCDIPDSVINQLFDALKLDFMDAENNESGKTLGFIRFGCNSLKENGYFRDTLMIKDTYANTLKLLTANGFNFSPVIDEYPTSLVVSDVRNGDELIITDTALIRRIIDNVTNLPENVKHYFVDDMNTICYISASMNDEINRIFQQQRFNYQEY